MPSPSSPLEYRPTPHLVLIIIFIFFPLIYLCGRLAITSCFILAFVLKSMFSPILHLFYGNELIPLPRITRYVSPVRILTNTMQEVRVEQSSDEQLTDESDRECELISTDDFIEAQPKTSTNMQAIQSSDLEIQTEDLHDSEHDSGNDEDHSALSVISTATASTDVMEAGSMPNHDNFNGSVQWHRDNTS
ncbi:hypothetical protein, variant [Loa loa]|uniref:Uncharacterized protein n=1 Tax=Loa loa TaxID=7209 RepID=A0A1S0UKW2_LOALO|nr:hypothetical protein LOAG_01499 [Loa loa]XP_020307018.1 hypothetical protein, variant [Loa loa]EFO26984.2 hypothetical protein LOAG_01499 [Loa loa]EJD76205.1 hypothetical protein, variant [Loa loa]